MDLWEFVMEAERTYAAGTGARAKALVDGSKEFVHKNGVWRYQDRWFGFDPFIGQEVIFREGQLEWSMNYRGATLVGALGHVEIGDVYMFLRKALQVGSSNRHKPFRGPAIFEDGDWVYTNKSKGVTSGFIGEEKISFAGHPAYHLVYHGGIVRSKS